MGAAEGASAWSPFFGGAPHRALSMGDPGPHSGAPGATPFAGGLPPCEGGGGEGLWGGGLVGL